VSTGGTPLIRAAAVVLAAGGSSRFGSPKPLIRVDGETFVARAVRHARDSGCDPVVAVVHDAAVASEAEKAGAAIRTNSKWKEGLSTSIAAGIEAIAADSSVHAVLILPCDQPKVTSGDLARLLSAFSPGVFAVASDYGNGASGIPAVFGCEAFPRLRTLDGDAGAKPLLVESDAEVRRIAVPHAAFDVDRPEDWPSR